MADIRTATLAEIYARQGHLDRACAILRELVAASPGDAGLAERLAELERALAGQAAGEANRRRVDRLRVLLDRVQSRRRRS